MEPARIVGGVAGRGFQLVAAYTGVPALIGAASVLAHRLDGAYGVNDTALLWI